MNCKKLSKAQHQTSMQLTYYTQSLHMHTTMLFPQSLVLMCYLRIENRFSMCARLVFYSYRVRMALNSNMWIAHTAHTLKMYNLSCLCVRGRFNAHSYISFINAYRTHIRKRDRLFTSRKMQQWEWNEKKNYAAHSSSIFVKLKRLNAQWMPNKI